MLMPGARKAWNRVTSTCCPEASLLATRRSRTDARTWVYACPRSASRELAEADMPVPERCWEQVGGGTQGLLVSTC